MARGSKRPSAAIGSADFIEEIAEFTQALRDEIADAAELGDFDRSATATRARVKRARADFEFFCRAYFPHRGRAPYSTFQRAIFERTQEIVFGPGGARDAWAAPRGNAKSTYWSELFPLWCVIFGHKRYPVILSDAIEVAAMLLEGVKTELEVNPRLAHDFPNAVGQGPVWQVGVAVTATGAKLQCGGAKKRIRGARHGAQRPDLVILDDLENDENVRSPEQRDKLEAWIDKAVEPLGPPDGSMDIVYVGTVLHLDSVLARKLKDPTWQAHEFQAIRRWPDRLDLWERWEEVLRNDGREAADAFYRAHTDAMELGAEVLWPEVQPLRQLMLTRARIGHAAFGAEYQNSPMAEDATFTAVRFWVTRNRNWRFFGALDPSLGRQNKARDPSAILVGGFDRESATLDVVEASIRKRLPDLIIEDVIALQREYRCLMWFVEAVQFQEFLRTELMKRAVQAGVALPARAVTPTSDKNLRIERLQPPIKDGLIRFHASQKVLLEQLSNWPQADHDDGPDALEMLWSGAVQFAPVGAAHGAGPLVFAAGQGGGPAGGLFGGGLFAGGAAGDESAATLDDGRDLDGINWTGY